MMDVKVLNLGTRWAGCVASMLLADRGAEVIKLLRPGRNFHPSDALLGRGKTLLETDLSDPGSLKEVMRLARNADILIENMRVGAIDRLALGYETLTQDNEQLVYVSLPGFAEGDTRRLDAAREASINAA